jgi:glycosyltransferase involved in cell wall biosynthesis
VVPPYPILLMARALDVGGTERQLAEIAMSLDRSRFSPHVGCFRPEGMRWQELQRAGVPLFHIPVTTFRAPSTLCAVARLGGYLRERSIQLVHTFDPPANLFGVPAARFLRVPVVLSSQRSFRSLRSAGSRRLLRLTDMIADGIVVNCRAVKSSLIEEDKAPAERIHLCYNGIDPSGFHPRRPARGASYPLVIAYLGVLRPEKSLGTLLEAFRQLTPADRALHLRIVGSGPSADALERQALTLGLGARCSFHPFTDQVGDVLREVDIFVLPSVSEALSNSLMEAMACGCAVVASRIGGNPELVTHGETGLLFEPGNSTDLAVSLRLLIADDSLRQHLGRNAAERIRLHFSLRDSAETMADIYERYLA